MTSARVSSWPADRIRAAGIVAACLALVAGCATMQRAASDTGKRFEAHVTRPVRYRLAGASPQARANLELGLRELDARSYRAAITALNHALWDLEQIRDRALRLSELRDVHDALARAYWSLGILEIAEEQRWMARGLAEAVDRAPADDASDALAHAKAAYATARFPDAGRQLRRALIDLEDVGERERRIAQLAHARCYLALSHYAAQDHERVREELRRLLALDPSMRACVRESPPGLRAMIAEVQRKPKDL
jgi:tetratricopeptide (TPR) repeat protein